MTVAEAGKQTKSDFAVEALQPRQAADLVALAGEVFSAHWTEAFVTWKYFSNPAGSPYAGYVSTGSRPGASFGNLPVRFKLGDQTILAAQAVDAMVVQELRRLGIFLKIAEQTYQQMDAAGIAFTYVFPSDAAATGFIKKLDYETIGYVPRYVKILDSAAVARVAGKHGLGATIYTIAVEAVRGLAGPDRLEGHHSDVAISMVEGFDGRFDGLWQAASARFRVATVRDSTYLNWRYATNPLRSYHILIAERGTRLTGCLVLRALPETQTAAILEWLAIPEDEATVQTLLAAATIWARHQKLVQLSCWLLPGHDFYQKVLRQSGFIHSPSKLAPGLFRQTTHFIVRTLPGSSRDPNPKDLRNWYVSLGDHDYY